MSTRIRRLDNSPSPQAIADGSRWEGDRLSVYSDSLGYPTQGRGRHTGVHFGDPDITPETLELWFAQDWQRAHDGALRLFPSLDQYDTTRREALIWLVFNMGLTTLSGFGPFIGHINACEWDEASFHVLTNMAGHITPYVQQVGARAEETALRICSGNVLKEFRV